MSDFRLSEDAKVVFMDFDPGHSGSTFGVGTNPFFDMEGYHRVTFIAFRTVGSGVVETAQIYAATDSSGTGAAAVGSAQGSTSAGGLLAGSASSAGAGVGMIVLEADHSEITNALSTATHVGLKMQCATAGDEFGIVCIRHRARNKVAGLTASGSRA